jgi:serine/threonine protein kinase
VYLGTHTVAGKEVAIKLQPTVPRNSPIRQESKIYKTLSGSPGIPWIMWSGKHGDFDVMILDLLGPSLEDLFKMCNKHFSLKTVLLIADQLVSTASPPPPHYPRLDVTRATFPFWAALTLSPFPLLARAYRIHPLPRFGPQRC